MSTFLSASAVRAQTVGSVGGAISLYAERHGVTAARVSTGAELGLTDVAVFSPVHGWVVVRWFSYAPHLPATLTLSSMLSTVAVAADVYDGDLWRNVVVDCGEVVDRFCSDVRYFSDDLPLGGQWAGQPDVVATTFRVDVRRVRPYYEARKGRAHTDDRFSLDDPMVFIDLWARLGIRWPETDAEPEMVLRLGEDWQDKLPFERSEF